MHLANDHKVLGLNLFHEFISCNLSKNINSNQVLIGCLCPNESMVKRKDQVVLIHHSALQFTNTVIHTADETILNCKYRCPD